MLKDSNCCSNSFTRLGYGLKHLITSIFFLSPASEASREVANLTERKNPHTPVYGVKEYVCLSVCLAVCYEFQPKLSQVWQNRMG